MKRLSKILLAAIIAAAVPAVGTPTVPVDTATAGPAPKWGLKVGVNVDLGVDFDRGRVTVNGVFTVGEPDGSPGSEIETGAKTESPGALERIRLGLAAARALGRATECVVAHCWRELRGAHG